MNERLQAPVTHTVMMCWVPWVKALYLFPTAGATEPLPESPVPLLKQIKENLRSLGKSLRQIHFRQPVA